MSLPIMAVATLNCTYLFSTVCHPENELLLTRNPLLLQVLSSRSIHILWFPRVPLSAMVHCPCVVFLPAHSSRSKTQQINHQPIPSVQGVKETNKLNYWSSTRKSLKKLLSLKYSPKFCYKQSVLLACFSTGFYGQRPRSFPSEPFSWHIEMRTWPFALHLL